METINKDLNHLNVDGDLLDENRNRPPKPRKKRKPFSEFGFIIDIDGVIARGAVGLPQSKEAFDLISRNGELVAPVMFVTNGMGSESDKARQLSEWTGVPIRGDQFIHAGSPLKCFSRWHQKRVLVVGQDNIKEIAEELGFKNIVLVEDIAEAFPDLDVVDHANRRRLAANPEIVTTAKEKAKDFEKIEVIAIMGEPKRWESALQILMDLLLTNGKPDHNPTDYPDPHISVVACNMDLVFKADAVMPRFGNGAFLACLEVLYKRITGRRLHYSALVGKPCELTTRYAEHCLTKQRRQMRLKGNLRRIYFIGDNPNVDIAGANWYNDYLKKTWGMRMSESSDSEGEQKDLVPDYLPSYRYFPEEADFLPLMAERCIGILVRTGVYHGKSKKEPAVVRTHRDICLERFQVRPKHIADDILGAFQHVIKREKFNPDEDDDY